MTKLPTIFAVLLGILLLTGCGAPYSQEKYDKIEMGMTKDQTALLLGVGESAKSFPADLSISFEEVLVWRNPQTTLSYIAVAFAADRVVAKLSNALDNAETNKWTSKKTEWLNRGMSYEEVRKVLSTPSQDILLKTADGHTERISKWVNIDGSRLTAWFRNGVFIDFKTRG